MVRVQPCISKVTKIKIYLPAPHGGAVGPHGEPLTQFHAATALARLAIGFLQLGHDLSPCAVPGQLRIQVDRDVLQCCLACTHKPLINWSRWIMMSCPAIFTCTHNPLCLCIQSTSSSIITHYAQSHPPCHVCQHAGKFITHHVIVCQHAGTNMHKSGCSTLSKTFSLM